jgi:hypothetical protein
VDRKRRLFGRSDQPPLPPHTTGGVVDRKKSGIRLMSINDDWLPAGGLPEAQHDHAPAQPEDWLPPDLPKRTAAAPSPERRRSTVRQVPPELQQRADMQSTLAEIREELAATRARLDALAGPDGPAA